jgi:hypothetical protein
MLVFHDDGSEQGDGRREGCRAGARTLRAGGRPPRRSGVSALLTEDAVVEIFHDNTGNWKQIAVLKGAKTIGAAVAGMMQAHPPPGWSHHTTHDHVIEVTGDEATLDAQFVVISSGGKARPALNCRISGQCHLSGGCRGSVCTAAGPVSAF